MTDGQASVEVLGVEEQAGCHGLVGLCLWMEGKAGALSQGTPTQQVHEMRKLSKEGGEVTWVLHKLFDWHLPWCFILIDVGVAWIIPGRPHRWAKAALARKKEIKECVAFLDVFIETKGAILEKGGST